MKKIELELETLAKITKGTKRKIKDINEVDVAEEINKLYRTYESLTRVASLVKLSPEMIRQIKSLTTLEEEVKKLYRAGTLKGYDIGYRISKLRGKDQIILAKHIVKKNLSSGDVRAIVKYRIDNPKKPIEKVVTKVIRSKDKKIYVAYLGIEKETFEKLIEKNKNKNREKVVKSILNGVITSKFIVSFKLNGRVVILKFLKEGLEEMRSKSKKLKVPPDKLANTLVKGYLEGNK